MSATVSPELVAQTLAAQGVATDSARAQAHASGISNMLSGTAQSFCTIALEQEPAAYVAELRRIAP